MINSFFHLLNLNCFFLAFFFLRYPLLLTSSVVFRILLFFTLFFHLYFGLHSIFKDYSNNSYFSYYISLLFTFSLSSLLFFVLL